MITASVSQAGSIREQNQNYLLVDARLHLAILSDGRGPNGRTVAETVARELWKRIDEIAPVTSGHENESRLNEAVELAKAACNNMDMQADNVSVSAIWLNRGIIAAITNGRCALAQSSSDWTLQRNSGLSLPVQPGQAFMLCSEGISALTAGKPVATFVINPSDSRQTSEESLQRQLENFVNELALTYDGDDRSAILIFLESSDISAGEPHELELFEHYNKEYTIPLWAPIAAAAGATASGVYALYKLKKYLPRIGIGHK